MKHCNACNRDLPLSDFHRKASARDGLQPKCRECNRAASKALWERRQAEGNPYWKNMPEPPSHKKNARWKVWHAIQTGRLQKPSVCSACNQPHERIQAHHEDYSRPLDVQWICHPCHRRMHAESNTFQAAQQ